MTNDEIRRNEGKPYYVKAQEGRFEVLNESGRSILVCHDEGSASQYAVLLNEAYRQGYKAGYRAGRKSAEG